MINSTYKITFKFHMWYFSSPSIHLLFYLDSINTTRKKVYGTCGGEAASFVTRFCFMRKMCF